MSIEAETIPVTAADGVTSELRLFAPASPRAVLLFHCGLGVPATYYEPFATALAEAGHAVALADARGVGSSSVRASRAVDFGYRELVELELPAAIEATLGRLPGVPCFVGGHSLGAQISVLASAIMPARVRGLILIAGGSLWYRNWTGSMRAQIRLASVLFPAVSLAVGWFPGRWLGFGVREGKTLMRDWARCAGTGRYRLRGASRDWELEARRSTRPVLAINIDGDDMAPPAAMKHLTDKLPRAPLQTELVALPRSGKGKPHFRWARDPQGVVEVMAQWLEARVAEPP